MENQHFPNGFASWQRTHFEVVEVLVYIRNLEEDKKPRQFSELIDRSGTEELYNLAKKLTDKFELEYTDRPAGMSLFDAIEDFVYKEGK